MSTLSPLQFDTSIFEGNLDALRIRQPRLVDRLRSVDVPGSVKLVQGRDGRPAVVLNETDGRIQWLGGSSMTSVSPQAALTDYADKGCNVILPSVGTGHEPVILAKRIPKHCAVFVYEPQIFHIALALAVAGMADLIRQGRIVFIDDPIETALPEFLAEHIGYDAPAQLFPLPGIDRPEMERRIAAMELVNPIVTANRIKHAENISASIRSDTTERRTGVLILSIDTGELVATQAAAIESASARLGVSSNVCIPRGPDQCSHVARLAAIERERPSLILFLNCTAGTLQEQIPAGMAWASWYLESEQLPVDALQGLERCSRIWATSSRVRELLISHGAREECVNILEAGVDTSRFETERDYAERDVDIAVFANGENVSPEAAGIGLESHQKLWRAAVSLMAEEPERFGSGEVGELLGIAEKRSGIHLTDESLRPNLLSLMANRLFKTMAVRATLANIQHMGVSIGLWGRNWDLYDETRPLYKGTVPGADCRNKEYNRSKLVLVPFLDVDGLRTVWEAVASGCTVLIPDSRAIADNYSQTGALLRKLPQFDRFGAIPELAQGLLGNSKQEKMAEVRKTLITDHAVVNRLEFIQQAMS